MRGGDQQVVDISAIARDPCISTANGRANDACGYSVDRNHQIDRIFLSRCDEIESAMSKRPPRQPPIETAGPSRTDPHTHARRRARATVSAAEIIRTVRACERAGKPVSELSIRPDGSYQLKFGSGSSPTSEDLDLVKMAKDNG